MKTIQARSYFGLLGVILLVIMVNIVSAQLFRGINLDLTEEKLYSLSQGSKNIIDELKDPITIKYYFSQTDSTNIPSFRMYGERVQDILRSYERLSSNITLESYDPRPDSEDAIWAEKYGLSSVDIGPGLTIFCGLVILNEMGDEQAIPYFDPQREEFLEYDISKALSSISTSGKPKLGVYSTLPITGQNQIAYPPQGGPQSEPWYFTQDLEQIYDVKMLHQIYPLDPTIDILLLIHPKELSPFDEYNIDQFLLKGKNLIVLADPFCESDQAPSNPQNPMMAMNYSRSSKLPQILTHSGIKLKESEIILDRDRATSVQTSPVQVTPFYAWLSLIHDDVNTEDAVTGKLETLLFPSPGYFSIDPKVTESFKKTILLESSPTAGTAQGSILLYGGSPEKIRKAYIPGAGKLPMAYRIQGKFQSSFKEGKPKEYEDKKSIHLEKGENESTVILISDVDFISNRYSLNVANFMGNLFISPLNDNLNLLFNSIESLSGSSNLTTIRSRGKFSRPFTKVAQIEAAAQAKWQEEEMKLLEKVRRANDKINSLMQKPGEEGKVVANEAVINEVAKFREEKLETQKALRQVRKSLRLEKEKLSTILFLMNTILVPMLIILWGGLTFISKNGLKS